VELSIFNMLKDDDGESLGFKRGFVVIKIKKGSEIRRATRFSSKFFRGPWLASRWTDAPNSVVDLQRRALNAS